jgi:hypothetical protein
MKIMDRAMTSNNKTLFHMILGLESLFIVAIALLWGLWNASLPYWEFWTEWTSQSWWGI